MESEAFVSALNVIAVRLLGLRLLSLRSVRNATHFVGASHVELTVIATV